jgi:nicotinamidase/pyrazinamidase
MSKAACVIVDVQNDFCAGGTLAVPGAADIFPVITRLIQAAYQNELMIIASRDWHPENHSSFIEQGGPWPRHCVQGTAGARWPAALCLPENTLIVSKGQAQAVEEYSAMLGLVEGDGRDLGAFLLAKGVQQLLVCGLALDYCVYETALQARMQGFAVDLCLPGTRGIDPARCQQCLQQLMSEGVGVLEAELEASFF